MTDQQRVPVGLRFKEAGKIYYFDARGFELEAGNYVVVETSHGQEIGRVVIAPDQVIASEIKETLKPILRLATPEDLEKASDLKEKAREQLGPARQRADDQQLDMHIISGDYSLDGSQVTFYFSAEDRVDFRSLVRELSTDFGTKVQLLQVGERDRAKLTDGYDRCGLRLCCSSWMSAFPTVSMKTAKEQDLPLNPSKLSGVCGRLFCCLTFEYEEYRELKGNLPKVGAQISTPTGDAKVLGISVPKETITLRMHDSGQVVTMPVDQFRLMYGTAVRPKELVETFERTLLDSAAREGAPEPELARQQPVVEELTVEQAGPQPAPQQKRRRRRGRRGGRRH
jgi:cell fate regulator YaaT (PSP1 superfamily)